MFYPSLHKLRCFSEFLLRNEFLQFSSFAASKKILPKVKESSQKLHFQIHWSAGFWESHASNVVQSELLDCHTSEPAVSAAVRATLLKPPSPVVLAHSKTLLEVRCKRAWVEGIDPYKDFFSMKKKDSTSKGVVANHPVETNALSIHPSIHPSSIHTSSYLSLYIDTWAHLLKARRHPVGKIASSLHAVE